MNKIIHLLYLVSIISLLPNSCSNSSEPINNRFDIELITYLELTSSIDSNLFYYKHYYDWEINLDTLKANSLANNFADDFNSISDMWFPQKNSHCKWRTNDNFVFINLSKHNESLVDEGYKQYTLEFLNCWSEFRHYKIH